jgi:hypothetical protein
VNPNEDDYLRSKSGGGTFYIGYYKMSLGLCFLLAFLVLIWFYRTIGLWCLGISIFLYAWSLIEYRIAVKRKWKEIVKDAELYQKGVSENESIQNR